MHYIIAKHNNSLKIFKMSVFLVIHTYIWRMYTKNILIAIVANSMTDYKSILMFISQLFPDCYNKSTFDIHKNDIFSLDLNSFYLRGLSAFYLLLIHQLLKINASKNLLQTSITLNIMIAMSLHLHLLLINFRQFTSLFISTNESKVIRKHLQKGQYILRMLTSETFILFQIRPYCLLLFSIYIRRKYWIRKNFQHPVFGGCFEMY